MASDRLNQLGRNLRGMRVEIQETSRRVAHNYPVIEAAEDIVGSINTFRFEFKTYNIDTKVNLNLVIKKKFRMLSPRDEVGTDG